MAMVQEICLPAEQVRFTGHGQPMEMCKIGGRTGTGGNISAAGDFKLSGGDVLSGGGIRHRRNKNPGAFTASGFLFVLFSFLFQLWFLLPRS